MIIVAGAFDMDPARRDEFIADRVPLIHRSRGEKGCLEYSFSADPVEAGRVVLFECWASQEALDAHVTVLRTDPPWSDGPNAFSQSVSVYDAAFIRKVGG